MIIEPLPFEFVDLSLTPSDAKPQRRTKSATPSANGPDRVRVSLGVPQVQRLDEGALAADAALQNFVRAHPDHRFHLLHLACTLATDDSRSFEDAELRVSLDATGLGGRPIAWSMDPRRVARTEKVERTSSLGANLKFEEIAGAELGSETKRTEELEHPYIVAYGEQESTPFWRISRIKTREVDGSFRFSMVVKSAGPATLDVSLEARVNTKLFGLIPYRTDAAAADPRLGLRLS